MTRVDTWGDPENRTVHGQVWECGRLSGWCAGTGHQIIAPTLSVFPVVPDPALTGQVRYVQDLRACGPEVPWSPLGFRPSGPSVRGRGPGWSRDAPAGRRSAWADPTPEGPRGRHHPDQHPAAAQALDHPPAPPPCPRASAEGAEAEKGFRVMPDFIPGMYRQHILAAIEVAGDVKVEVTTHGGGRDADGAHISATFAEQLMITMYDQLEALTYAYAWRKPEDEWVFDKLPALARKGVAAHPIVRGPALTIRAHGQDDTNAGYDAVAGSARVRIGSLTWSVLDRAAADTIRDAWRYVAQLAPIVLPKRTPTPPRRG